MKLKMTLIQAYNWATRELREHRCSDQPGLEAEALLTAACGIDRAAFLTHPEKNVPSARLRRFREKIRRRRRHEPLAYLLGSAAFCGREFSVSPGVLIPRPATESIVEAAVAAARAVPETVVVDVGTGSGAIAVTLAAELPGRTVMATDSSGAALKIARGNARRVGIGPRIIFRRGDLIMPFLKKIRGSPAVIVANLPYIPTADWRKLPPDIKKFEPRLALDGGRDGLGLYRSLLNQLAKRSTPTTVIMEILPRQRRAIETFCRKIFRSCRFEVIKNLAGVTIGLKMTA